MLKSLVSPTAVIDDDLPFTGIEMPEHQPTAKMTQVNSAKDFYVRKEKMSLQSSAHSTSQQKRSYLDEILKPAQSQRKGAPIQGQTNHTFVNES